MLIYGKCHNRVVAIKLLCVIVSVCMVLAQCFGNIEFVLTCIIHLLPQLAAAFIDDQAIEADPEPDEGDEEPAGINLED